MSILSQVEKQAVIEIQSVGIENFKNVENGQIDFSAGRDEGASVTGIYGPNGSGKTALMDAVDILKMVLMGKPLGPDITEKISVGQDRSRLTWTFDLRAEDDPAPARVVYRFDIVKSAVDSAAASLGADSFAGCYIENETVRVATKANGRTVNRCIIDTAKGDVMGPRQQFRELTGGGGLRIKTQLQEQKKVAKRESRSFVFSPEFLNLAAEKSRDREAVRLLAQLHYYALSSLFVVSTRDSSLPVLDMQTLPFSREDQRPGAAGSCIIPVDRAVDVRADFLEFLQERLRNVSRLLESIVPGQQIELNVLREYTDEANTKMYCVEVMSRCDGKSFPFRYESDGIKKLVSVLELLASVYARPGVTLAIDELDSGVFEYLLGDILRMIADQGEGQLIFTSHNLRPMELLNPINVVLTTVDAKERYTRLKGIKDNHNIRKFYIRELFLEQSVPLLWNPTDNNSIAIAFQKIGAKS